VVNQLKEKKKKSHRSAGTAVRIFASTNVYYSLSCMAEVILIPVAKANLLILCNPYKAH